MTQAEKKRLSAVLHATEFLFLENIALKLVLEHRAVPNWQKLVDHLLADKEMLGGVRLTFRDLYREIEKSSDPAAALEAFLGKIPAQKKTNRAKGGGSSEAAFKPAIYSDGLQRIGSIGCPPHSMSVRARKLE